MPEVVKGHRRLKWKRTQRPAEASFLEDLAKAHSLGRRHRIEPDLGLHAKREGLDGSTILAVEELGRGCIGARHAAWAAFYRGIVDQSSGPCPSWRCIEQQELTNAFYYLPPATVAMLLQAHKALDAPAHAWKIVCTGAIAVARVACAFHEASSKCVVYMPGLAEDFRGKIDLICDLRELEARVCLQIKSDAHTEETTFEILPTRGGRATSPLGRFQRGVASFGRRQNGGWSAVLMTVGQKAHFDRPEVRDCPDIQRGVENLLATYARKAEPTS